MKKVALRYMTILGGTVFLFVNFIACGAQMYQVSMEDDYVSQRTTAQVETNPAAPEFGIHAVHGWAKLPVEFRVSEELTPVQKAGLIKAMKTWELAVGRKLFAYGGDDSRDGDSFADLYSSLPDKVNGHYLDDNWSKTGKKNEVLATTIWDNVDPNTIGTADIRFNADHYTIFDSLDEEGLKLTTSLDPGKQVVDMESLALHELGHLLGLEHMDADHDQYSIMNPRLFIGEGLATRKLSRGDVERIQRIYGCEGPSCDVDELLVKFEQNDQAQLAKDAGSESASPLQQQGTAKVNTY